ncbi:hypothetical protein MMC26_004963 [Xylographa opegraphella]|nr:hypothetical protein [Xylographa opegraphella]
MDASAGHKASPRISQEAAVGLGAELAFVVGIVVAAADAIEAVSVLEDMTGLPEVLVTVVIDNGEIDEAVPVAAGVEAAALTPLILRLTRTLPHNCCANCTVAKKQPMSTNGTAD